MNPNVQTESGAAIQVAPTPAQEQEAVREAQEAAAENPIKEQAQDLAEIPDLDDEDIVSAAKIVPLILTLASGQQRKVFIKRLTGNQAIKLLRDAASAKGQNDVPVLKLTRCVVNPKDHSKARYSQVNAIHLIEEGDANLLLELLRCIHLINPVIKSA